MRHKTTQMILAYFNRVRSGRRVPLRTDIDPTQLKTALPDVFILEVGRSGRMVFRLAGTRVCAIVGRELRGMDFDALWHVPNWHKMKLGAQAVVANRQPLHIDIRSFADEEDRGELEMLLMPLSSRPGAVDRLFGSLVDLSQPPLLGERSRVLWADRMTFIRDDIDLEEEMAGEQETTLSVYASGGPSLRARITHLKLLQGGRKD